MVKTTWKQRVAAAVCTASLALALPMAAFAAPSAENTWTDTAVTTSPSLGTTVNASGTVINAPADLSGFNLYVEPSETQASNTQVSDTQVAVASFEVTAEELQNSNWVEVTNVGVRLTFDLGTQEYNGYTATVYIEHADGATETRTQTIVNGTVTIEVDRLSVFTVVVDTDSAPTPGQPGTSTEKPGNKAPTSPQTGVDVAGAAAGTVAMAVAAAGVAVALRKRVNG